MVMHDCRSFFVRLLMNVGELLHPYSLPVFVILLFPCKAIKAISLLLNK